MELALLEANILEPRPHTTTCSLQCCKVSGQTTTKIGTQPHPSEDRLPKVILSSQPPQNAPLEMALPFRGTRPSPTHQRTGTSPSHQEACTRPWTNLTYEEADTRSKRNYNPAACGKETTNTESRQNEKTEKYVANEGTR